MIDKDLEAKYSVINERLNNVIKDMDDLIRKMDLFFGSVSQIQSIIDRWIGALRIISLLLMMVMAGFSFFIKRELDQNDIINNGQSQIIDQIRIDQSQFTANQAQFNSRLGILEQSLELKKVKDK